MSKEISVLSSDDISAVLATINLIQTPVYLIDIDRTGTLRYFAVNQSEEEALGYSCGQACGQRLEDVLDPDFAERRAQACRRCVETRSVVEFENFIDRNDGRRWRRTTLVPLFDVDGRLSRVMGTGRDITKQKRTEEDLSQAHQELQNQIADQGRHEQRFRRVFDEGPLGMALVDGDRRIIEVNQAFCEFLGYTEDELLGMDGNAITDDDDIETSREIAARLFRGEIASYRVEKRYVRKDGRSVWANLTASLIRDANGRALYGLAMAEDIHERKLAEASAERATSLFENAAKLAGLGSWEFDLKTGRMFCSEEARRLYQLPADKPFFTRDEAHDRVHPDDRHIPMAGYEKLLRTGEPVQMEYRLQFDDGTIRHDQLRTKLESEDGKPVRIIGVSMDITDRKEKDNAIQMARTKLEKANWALKSSEVKFRTVLESSPDGILVASRDGTIAMVNRRTEEIFGYGRDELIGQSVETLVPAGHQGAHIESRTGYTKAPNVRMMGIEQKLSGRRKDGSEIPVEISLSPADVEGEPLVVAMIRDVTESRAILEARLQLASIVDASTDAIIRMDLDGTIVGWNKGAETMFGYTEEEMIGEHASKLAGPEQHEEQRLNSESLLNGKAVIIPETVRLRKDGRPIDASASVFPLRNANGEITGIAAIARDITEQLKLQRQFQEAQRMEAIGTLAGGVAHDFNNILTVITGYSSLIQDQLPSDSPLLSSLQAQAKASERGAALTRQLLAFGRKQRFAPKVLEFNSAVSELQKVLRRTLGEDIDIVTVLASKGHVKTDPAQLEQVIVNLAVNARHAMPQGGKLTIRTSDIELDEADASELGELLPGDYSVLTVSDTGTGMAPDTLHHIFEPFFTTKKRGEGTGLGLAAVYGIVRQSKGAITVESELGIGSVFQIHLPRVPAPETELEVAGNDVKVARGEGTILLVEDDYDLTLLAASVLREKGYTVFEVTSPSHAIEVFDRTAVIDLVLTDVVMPDMSGPQLVEQLRSRGRDFKVLYMSGYTGETSSASRLVGDDTLIDKPFTPIDLVLRVRDVLRGSDNQFHSS